MSIAEDKFVSLSTYRASGQAVATVVWVVALDDGRLGFYTGASTGTAGRLADDPRVVVRRCDARGRVTDGSAPLTGTATMVRSGRAFAEVQGKVRSKYGAATLLHRLLDKVRPGSRPAWTHADTVVLMTLDPPTG